MQGCLWQVAAGDRRACFPLRELFRGSLPRLNHSKGMKWYLAQNNILCKQYQDHVKEISQQVKKAALAPFQEQDLLVKHIFSRDDKEPSRARSQPREGSRKGMYVR